MSRDIARIGVVVPACNEVDLLPYCLEAIDKAARQVEVPVHVVVALDDCTDGTDRVCDQFCVDTVTLADRNVGLARAAGVRAVLGHRPLDQAADDVWLANTDADTRVSPSWLCQQISMAADGADAVLGVVRVDDDGPLQWGRPHEVAYAKLIGRDGSHRHVHGANLGVRASAYLRAGGFPPLTDHEDRELVVRLQALRDVTIVRSDRVYVLTSGRHEGRCREGFAADLARMAASGLSVA